MTESPEKQNTPSFLHPLSEVEGEPVLYLSKPKGIEKGSRRAVIDAINELNQRHFDSTGDPEIQSRIASYEMSASMQDIAPEVTDISKEPKHIQEMYGAEPGKRSFANNCRLVRRLVERGVRFIELFHESWDQHVGLESQLKRNCKDVDQACAALIKDLKQRGMLEDTIVIFGGEFGLTPWSKAEMTAAITTQMPSPCGSPVTQSKTA